MKRGLILACGVAAAASLAPGANADGASYPDAGGKSPAQLDAQFKRFTDQVADALGLFHDIQVFERDGKTWKLAKPKDVLMDFIPVTVNGKTPTTYTKDMASDRPMILPTHVEGFDGGDGQSVPYSVAGRMPGSNPEVQWTFAVRQYWIKSLTDDDFATSPDMAVIGHHPRTGASVYLQYYNPEHPKDSRVVVSPFSEDGRAFYSALDTIAAEFQCQRCHVASPFIHTPWINQVQVRDDPMSEAIVPSSPFGPFFFIDSEPGGLFAHWNDALVTSGGGGHLSPSTNNKCTTCHRVAPDLIGLNQNATRYAGLELEQQNVWSVHADLNQTVEYRSLHWMGALAPPYVDFYAGQSAFAPDWEQTYGPSAAQLNIAALNQDTWTTAIRFGLVDDLPRPPKAYQTIMVDRPNQDRIPSGESLWVVDSRMRANTHGDLYQWRFFAKDAGDPSVTAAPAILRRMPGDGSTIEYDVVFIGASRGAENGGDWQHLNADGSTVRIQQGDYLAVVFTNTGSESAAAPIPYTEDDWAKLTRNGLPWLRDGSVTYRLATGKAPAETKQLVFNEMAFLTYSFEFKNKL